MKKTTLILTIIVIVILALFTACAKSKTAQYHKITAADGKKRMDENTDVIMVDVRSQEEYEAGHIKGAILIPLDTISGTQPEQLPNLDDEILVYCRSGRRSSKASGKLANMGYTQIYDMGGIQDWPYEVVSGSE